jgi:hypothetical protein
MLPDARAAIRDIGGFRVHNGARSGPLIFNSSEEVPMKTGGRLSIAAICLVISSTVLFTVHSTMATRHGVIPIAEGDAVFVPAVTEVQLISNTAPPPPESACFAVAYDASRPNP